jgi:hypothetical protein
MSVICLTHPYSQLAVILAILCWVHPFADMKTLDRELGREGGKEVEGMLDRKLVISNISEDRYHVDVDIYQNLQSAKSQTGARNASSQNDFLDRHRIPIVARECITSVDWLGS